MSHTAVCQQYLGTENVAKHSTMPALFGYRKVAKHRNMPALFEYRKSGQTQQYASIIWAQKMWPNTVVCLHYIGTEKLAKSVGLSLVMPLPKKGNLNRYQNYRTSSATPARSCSVLSSNVWNLNLSEEYACFSAERSIVGQIFMCRSRNICKKHLTGYVMIALGTSSEDSPKHALMQVIQAVYDYASILQ